jgi:hypothetical protein
MVGEQQRDSLFFSFSLSFSLSHKSHKTIGNREKEKTGEAPDQDRTGDLLFRRET